MSARLRRDEPPHPTPSFLVAAKRSGEMMEAFTAGASHHAIAQRFGVRSAEAAARTIARDRDRLRPPDFVAALNVELDAASMLVDRMYGRMRVAPPTERGQRWFTGGCRLLDHHITLIRLKQDHAGERDGEPDEPNLAPPAWTELLELRARGVSFHTIAATHDLDDFYKANVAVTQELDAYLCAAVARLRRYQVAELDRRWARAWLAVSKRAMPDPSALTESTALLRERAHVRGLFVPKPLVEPEHPFEARRWGDPHRRRCCEPNRRTATTP